MHVFLVSILYWSRRSLQTNRVQRKIPYRQNKQQPMKTQTRKQTTIHTNLGRICYHVSILQNFVKKISINCLQNAKDSERTLVRATRHVMSEHLID